MYCGFWVECPRPFYGVFGGFFVLVALEYGLFFWISHRHGESRASAARLFGGCGASGFGLGGRRLGW